MRLLSIKWLALLVGVLLLAAVTTVDAAPKTNQMQVIGEYTTCGADCVPNDGCVGIDETLVWYAYGDLGRGASWTGQSYNASCGVRQATATVCWKGNADLTLQLGDSTNYKYTKFGNQRCIRASLLLSGAFVRYDVTLTNRGQRHMHGLLLTVTDRMRVPPYVACLEGGTS